MIKLFSNFKYIKYSFTHIIALNKLAFQLKVWKPRFLLHDVDKLILYTFLSTDKVSKIHRAKSIHHIQNGTIKDPLQAVLDWESARFTKKDKPLSARDFYHYKKFNMPEVLKIIDDLGL